MTKSLFNSPTSSSARKTFDREGFLDELRVNGYSIIHELIPQELVARLRKDLEHAIEQEKNYHGTQNHKEHGMVMFCPIYGQSFIDLLELECFLEPVECVVGENCIVYSYTSSSLPPHSGNYGSRVHNDCYYPIFDEYVTRFGILIALDDFNEKNGATYVLPGSQNLKEAPSEEEFYAGAIRLTMKAGSVWFANQKVWHAGGVNQTDTWRHSVTVGFCRSYMKQRVDAPRMLSNLNWLKLSDRAKQKLGFYAQVPTTYDEYYAPPDQRMFKQPID